MNTTTEQQTAILPTAASVAKTSFSVEGMNCTSCVAKVENALSAHWGVLRASVNFSTKTVQVEYNPTQVSVDAMQSAVAQAGYKLFADGDTIQEDRKQRAQGHCEVPKKTYL